MSLERHPIVEVQWIDASYQYDAEGVDDLPTLKEESTVGHLLEDDGEVVTVAQTHDEFGYRCLVVIPRAGIVFVKQLGPIEGEDLVSWTKD